jgi:hypothetical protein
MEVNDHYIIVTKDAYNAIVASVKIVERRLHEAKKILDSVIQRCEKEKENLGHVLVPDKKPGRTKPRQAASGNSSLDN